MPILLSAKAIGLLIATVWAAALGQNVNATFYGVFFGLLTSGNLTGSTIATRAGGWFVFLFVAIVGYFYAAALWEETGGSQLPLGKPLVG